MITLLRSNHLSLFHVQSVTDTIILINSTVLTLTNREVLLINELVLNVFPGDPVIYLSADKASDNEQEMIVPVAFLNSIETGSLLPHKLSLKVGAPIMLLRNLNPGKGLCNGTKLIIQSLLPSIIEAAIATGSHVGDVVYIPKIKIIIFDDRAIPVAFTRNQFPIRLAFGTTVNKSQR